MRIVLISEENHGIIAAAKDYRSSIEYLARSNWIRSEFEIGENETIISALGEDWKEQMIKWNSFVRLENFLNGLFTFECTELYE